MLPAARCLLYLGCAALQQGEYGQAEAYLRNGLAAAREIAHHDLVSRLLNVLHTVALKQGDPEKAAAYAREGRE
ncbi:MAG: hypothetical protein IMW89_05850 [Ktedonobacteraceae bacterium]|nr:hypothetical protein [Ktedonobacteraceae bacterium]